MIIGIIIIYDYTDYIDVAIRIRNNTKLKGNDLMANICTSDISIVINDKTSKLVKDILELNSNDLNLINIIKLMKINGTSFNDEDEKIINASNNVSIIPYYDETYFINDDPIEVYLGGESKWDFPTKLIEILNDKLGNAISYIAIECGCGYCCAHGSMFELYSYVIDFPYSNNIPIMKSVTDFQGLTLVRSKHDLVVYLSEVLDLDRVELDKLESMEDITQYLIENIDENEPFILCEISHC